MQLISFSSPTSAQFGQSQFRNFGGLEFLLGESLFIIVITIVTSPASRLLVVLEPL